MEKSKYMEVIKNKNKVEGLWDCVENNNHGEEDAAGVYPWPPRSYTCSFCKRQFRSAQALGGHMNIHRRDRARLRQYSPPPPSDHQGQNGQFSFLNLNLEPNPNNNLNFNTNPSNISSSSSSPKWGPPPPTTTAATFTSKLPPLFASSTLSSTLPATSISEMRTWGKKGISQISDPVHKDPDFGKIRATKRLNLELEDQFPFRKDTNVMKRAEFVRLELEIGLLGEEDEDLDLELRLGYA